MAEYYLFKAQLGELTVEIPLMTVTYDQLIELTLGVVAAGRNRRQYAVTFDFWKIWCDLQNIDPLNLTTAHIESFFEFRKTSPTTQQRELLALRKLAFMLFVVQPHNPTRRSISEALTNVTISAAPNTSCTMQALSIEQTQAVLRMWDGDRNRYKRNRAIIALLFFTGMTRSEIAALQWDDIDLMEGIITIHRSDGDRSHQVAIAGTLPFYALQEWYERCGVHRQYVFCRVNKFDRLGPDRAVTDTTIYRVVKETQQSTNIDFSPQDARKTFAQEARFTGLSIGDIGAQLGLKSMSGLVRYAEPESMDHDKGNHPVG